MDLFLFPAPADDKSGYNIAVKAGYQILQPQLKDIVVWCSLNNQFPFYKKTDYRIPYIKFFSRKAIFRIIRGRFSQELSAKDLFFLEKKNFDNIHCDDVIFYRAIRELFPDKKISVRFHNVFSRIKERGDVLKIKSDWRFRGKMKILSQLEQTIFRDNNVKKIFLSDKDAAYYSLITAKDDYTVWPMNPDVNLMKENRKPIKSLKNIVWLGGVEGHKTSSIKWFINNVFPSLKEKIPYIEFHLYGANTEQFNAPAYNIYGHGYYRGEDLPMQDNSLFINPDILGGGIKIKLMTFFHKGVPFISSPFGYEGYNPLFIDNEYCYVCTDNYWAECIISIFNKSNIDKAE